MEQGERTRIMEAAKHAKLRLFPDSPIGDLIYWELEFYAGSDRRYATNSTTDRLVDEIYRLQNSGFVMPPHDRT